MSNEPQPVSLAQLLHSSQTACRRPTINPERLLAAATPPAPAPAHNSDLIANHGNIVNLSPSHPALSPLMRMTGTGIYPALPMHTTGNPTTMLPQPYVRPGPVVAGLLSHTFNPNAFLGDPPESSAPAFVGANTTGRKKASILRMTLGKGQAPICHILIYLFVSPVHRLEAEKKDNPHVQRGYTLPESDVYNLEETVTQFRTHMTKLDLCIMYRMTTNDTYKDIHAQLLTHNMVMSLQALYAQNFTKLPLIPTPSPPDGLSPNQSLLTWQYHFCIMTMSSHVGYPSHLEIRHFTALRTC
ncbi:hypothetical protein F5146DRAFT_1146972 [Armillaria mellea]|nr:hypothetical protein F5146DRAFT_1146972 [Armillaria mellea]